MPAVVVAWRPGCQHRHRAWGWVRARYAAAHPDWEIVLAPGPEPADWSKGAAIMSGARATGAEVLVIADADVWTDGLADAVRAVEHGGGWAIPHHYVHRLTEAATTSLLAGADPDGLATTEAPYRGVNGGGIVVLARDTLEQIPMDPRFIGWGGEDQAWGYALACLAGRPWRARAPLIHLFHPPAPRRDRRVGNAANERLRRRYARARVSRARMTQILAEVNA